MFRNTETKDIKKEIKTNPKPCKDFNVCIKFNSSSCPKCKRYENRVDYFSFTL